MRMSIGLLEPLVCFFFFFLGGGGGDSFKSNSVLKSSLSTFRQNSPSKLRGRYLKATIFSENNLI